MRGDELLLFHLALLDEPDDADERPSADERVEAELGRELTQQLLASLARG